MEGVLQNMLIDDFQGITNSACITGGKGDLPLWNFQIQLILPNIAPSEIKFWVFLSSL